MVQNVAYGLIMSGIDFRQMLGSLSGLEGGTTGAGAQVPGLTQQTLSGSAQSRLSAVVVVRALKLCAPHLYDVSHALQEYALYPRV